MNHAATVERNRVAYFFQVVLKPVAEWIQDDGVRSLEDPWKYNGKLIETLKALRIPFVQIGERMKDIQARVEYTRLCLSQ